MKKSKLTSTLCIKYILYALFVLIIVNGCQEQQEETQTSGNDYYNYRQCYWDYYYITYIDEIFQENCYAIKQNNLNSFYLKKLNQSLQYADLDVWEMIEEELNCSCDNVDTMGTAYCLRDNSTCLIIEENRICQIIKLK